MNAGRCLSCALLSGIHISLIAAGDKMSPALLSKRLKALNRDGVVEPPKSTVARRIR